MGMQSYVLNRLTQAFARGNIAEYRRQQHSAMAFYLTLATIGTLGISAIALWAPLTRWFNLVHTPREVAALIIVLLGAQVLWALAGSGGILRLSYCWSSCCFSVGYECLSSDQYGVHHRSSPDLEERSGSGGCTTRRLAALASCRVVGCSSPLSRSISRCCWRKLFRCQAANAAERALWVDHLRGCSGISGIESARSCSTRRCSGSALCYYAHARQCGKADRHAIQQCSMDRYNPDGSVRGAGAATLGATTNHRCQCVRMYRCCGATLVRGRFGNFSLDRGSSSQMFCCFAVSAAYVVLQAPWAAAAVFGMSTNRHKNLAGSYLVANVVGLAVAALLIRHIGLVGVPVGLICGEAIACYHFVLAEACKIATEPYGCFAARLWLAIGILATMSLLATWYVHQLTKIPMMARWGLSGAVSIAVVAVITWFGWLLPGDRKVLGAKVKYGWERFCTRIA